MRRIALSLLALSAWAVLGAQPLIVAHRGYWKAAGDAQNSLEAMQEAAQIYCYGCELDVWMTADGVPVVNHDATFHGFKVEDTNYVDLMNIRLNNGEFLPTLQQYLHESLKYPNMQLILEVKSHKTPEREAAIVKKTVELIRMLNLEKRTEYIAFSKYVCEQLHELAPKAKVAYLSGDLSPKEVKDKGWTGIDYNEGVFKKHPEWLKEAKQLGVEVNVWTVDGKENLEHHAAIKEIDIITTNDPHILRDILKAKAKK